MKARDLRMRMIEHRRPSRVIHARGCGGPQRTRTHAHTHAAAKVLVSSFSHSTKPDKGDPGATLDGLQGRDITSSQKEVDKMPNANEERIKWKSFGGSPPPQQLHSHCLGSRLRPQRRSSDGRIGIRLSVDGGLGKNGRKLKMNVNCMIVCLLPPFYCSLLSLSHLPSDVCLSPSACISLFLPLAVSLSPGDLTLTGLGARNETKSI